MAKCQSNNSSSDLFIDIQTTIDDHIDITEDLGI